MLRLSHFIHIMNEMLYECVAIVRPPTNLLIFLRVVHTRYCYCSDNSCSKSVQKFYSYHVLDLNVFRPHTHTHTQTDNLTTVRVLLLLSLLTLMRHLVANRVFGGYLDILLGQCVRYNCIQFKIVNTEWTELWHTIVMRSNWT